MLRSELAGRIQDVVDVDAGKLGQRRLAEEEQVVDRFIQALHLLKHLAENHAAGVIS